MVVGRWLDESHQTSSDQNTAQKRPRVPRHVRFRPWRADWKYCNLRGPKNCPKKRPQKPPQKLPQFFPQKNVCENTGFLCVKNWGENLGKKLGRPGRPFKIGFWGVIGALLGRYWGRLLEQLLWRRRDAYIGIRGTSWSNDRHETASTNISPKSIYIFKFPFLFF